MNKNLKEAIAVFCIELILLMPLYTVSALTIDDVKVVPSALQSEGNLLGAVYDCFNR